MLPKLCTKCSKWFSCKISLNRHVKNIHGDRDEKDVCGEALSIDIPRQGEMDEFDDLRQSGGLYGAKPSRDFLSDQSGVDAVSQSECDDNEYENNDDSGFEFSDRSDEGSLDTLYDFCQLDIWGAINKWSGDKTGKQKLKFVLNRLFKLMLLSRASHDDDVCN